MSRILSDDYTKGIHTPAQDAHLPFVEFSLSAMELPPVRMPAFALHVQNTRS